MRSTTRGIVIGVAITATAGCGGRVDTTPTPTTTSAPTSMHTTAMPAPAVQTRSVKWVDLQAGDCLADPPPTDPAVVQVNVVDCGQPHLAETYLRVPIPVNSALDDVAARECATGFARYTGTAATAGSYTTSYLIDSDQDRTSDNPYPSTVICLLQGAQGQPLTGSARR
ncbi:hypothetical protein Y900_005320 [Mycolicibacterium aromaticivorans JS19b1 = JCM 16368]|uniref:Lipoprotein LppN n=1 Tax=Mycolicibacterium aromaticivorans JS19b1 = JCM 16368 TaxID=1440774 RepID=A0A064CFC8_9MYCO|nr:hypothetical protein [Mycolicibacterium aromaticivorans]KDE98371.1 hypothetical protein Y900_005320 [Mycolicibacterium aromaticivorans JS19b1 = JCM 16368]